jgi:branched-chain amino acid transport system substrate-binding protein
MRKNIVTSLAILLAGSTAALAQSASDGKVKIGILNDQSGVYADFGANRLSKPRRWQSRISAEKVLDVPVELVDADHQNKPDIASNIARQWYDTEQVDAIMELTTSSVALAVQALSKEKKKINMVTGAATTDLTGKQCSPYGFHWAYDTHALAVGTGGALVKQGGDSWFFLTADYAFGYSLEEQTGTFVKSAGGNVVVPFVIRSPRMTSRHSCCRRSPPAQRSSASPTPVSIPRTRSSRLPSSASPRVVRTSLPWLFTLAEVHGLGVEAAQGADADGGLLLEPR